MLNKPTINELMDVVDSKYTLVIITAKRARYVIDHDPDATATGSVNPVSLALKEIINDDLHWEFEQPDAV